MIWRGPRGDYAEKAEGLSRDLRRLAAALSGIDGPLPAWGEPVGDRDTAADSFMGQALALGPGGLASLGAAVSRRRLPLLYRYSVRAASRAVSANDPGRCQSALAAAVVADWNENEPRELMVNLAPHHVAATRVIGHAAELFEWAAVEAAGQAAETLQLFGRRTDITLEAFAWKQVINPGGTWFVRNW